MNTKPLVVLSGNSLTIADIVAIGIGDKHVALDVESLVRCRASRTFLEEEVAAGRIIYGVNTSFGPMCNKIIAVPELEALQVNLIRSHAAGLGDPIKPYMARAVLVVRLNSLVKGYSGVRIELLEHLVSLINYGIAPYIPECGSVGASGDLIHLAHAALAVIGEGDVYLGKELMSASDAYKKVGLTPLTLKFKEGIALMNGTSAMTALAAFALFTMQKLLNIACVNAAFTMEVFGGIDDAFDPDLHTVKPHVGQQRIAAVVASLFQGSGNITPRAIMHEKIRKQDPKNGLVFETSINVQDVYSIRCTPQILAPVYDAFKSALVTVETEANSTNDNPVIIPEKKKVIHGGNFHGQSIGYVMDALAIAIAQLCTLSERRINKLLDKNLNEGLPEHLIAGTPGLCMGFMGAQYLATSTTAENRQLANPVSTHSIPCNAENQDVVSMGTIAARKAARSASNAKHVLTLETLVLMQALSFRNSDKLGTGTQKIHELLSKHFTVYDNQRIMHPDLVKFRKLLFSTPIFDDLGPYTDQKL